MNSSELVIQAASKKGQFVEKDCSLNMEAYPRLAASPRVLALLKSYEKRFARVLNPVDFPLDCFIPEKAPAPRSPLPNIKPATLALLEKLAPRVKRVELYLMLEKE